MRTAVELLQDQVKDIPTVGRRTAVFVEMVGNLALVNTDPTSIVVPCVGFSPPIPGMVVQLERLDGQWKVTGPAVAQPAIGTISATGTPQALVTINGTDYPFYVRFGYTPSIGDQVEVNWATGVIQGKITGSNAGTTTPANGTGGSVLISNDPVLAWDSGQFRSRWQSNAVRASDTVSGAWFYNGRVAAALAGVNVTAIGIYLPLTNSPVGACFVGTHGYATEPGGWTGIANQVALPARSGWVGIPAGSVPAFAAVLASGGGIAVTSGSGDTQWAGTQTDSLSGALRFVGTR